MSFSGGCQCGAVRYRAATAPAEPHLCHCRMCQKAFGNVIAPLVSVREAKLTWTKAEPARFQSSNIVRRGFCPNCGTPLTYEAPDGVAVAIGAFDHPAAIVPDIQYGIEGRVPWLDHLNDWPGRTTMEDLEAAPFLDEIVSHQHPDAP